MPNVEAASAQRRIPPDSCIPPDRRANQHAIRAPTRLRHGGIEVSVGATHRRASGVKMVKAVELINNIQVGMVKHYNKYVIMHANEHVKLRCYCCK